MIVAILASVIQPGLKVIARVPDQPARLMGLDNHQAGFDAWAWYTDPVRRRQGSSESLQQVPTLYVLKWGTSLQLLSLPLLS